MMANTRHPGGKTARPYTRLAVVNGFDQPDRELSEADAIALAVDREQEEREAEEERALLETQTAREPGEGEARGPGSKRPWTAQDIGAMVLGVRAGKTNAEIGAAQGRTEVAVSVELTLVRRWVMRDRSGNSAAAAAVSPLSGARRTVTEEQEARVHKLRREGLTLKHIALRLDLTESKVKWCLAHPRDDR